LILQGSGLGQDSRVVVGGNQFQQAASVGGRTWGIGYSLSSAERSFGLRSPSRVACGDGESAEGKRADLQRGNVGVCEGQVGIGCC
jgi:hypothetical protein